MPHARRGRRRLWFALVVAAAVAGATAGAGALHRRQLNALFAGPEETVADARTGFFPGIEYDLAQYAAGTPEEKPAPERRAPNASVGDLMERPVEPSLWDEGEPTPHEEWKIDAQTGATKAARLRSPTVHRERWPHRSLTITSPADNALFPPNLCAPFIEWEDAQNDLWQVTVSLPGRASWSMLSAERRLRIPDDVWARIVAGAVTSPARVDLRGIRRSGLWGKERATVHRARPVTLRVSKDPADNFVVYRLVDPPFINAKTPNMFVRDLRELSPRPFLLSRGQYCFNCHTFSSKSGNTGKVSIQVRYNGTGDPPQRIYMAVYDFDRRSGYKAILPFDVQMSTFMAWSPDGTKLVTSANQKIVAFNPVVLETQSVGQPTSDVAVFDAVANTARLVPGASAPDVLEIYPCWTPDGKNIVYSSAPSGKHPSATKFDLRVIPWSGAGGTPRDLPGASGNGRSNFYARFSPDAKWMSFVQADSDSLIKASSDIWLMPGTLVGPPIRLECNVPFAADSWHSWSTNSRWLVFASKRDDGIYTRLYLTHIDDAGHASAAVALPVEDPGERMCFNIPEFVANPPPVDEPRLYRNVGLDAEPVHVKSIDVKADNDID